MSAFGAVEGWSYSDSSEITKQNLELFYTEFSRDKHTTLFIQHAAQLSVREQDFISFPLGKATFLRCVLWVMQHCHYLTLLLLKGM